VKTVDAPPAHRLVLTAVEWALLTRLCGFEPPAGFEAVSLGGGLAVRGVVTADPYGCRPVAPVVANLATLAAPTAAVRMEISVHGRGLRALFAISGPLGASLFALAGGAVEMSMFAAEALGRELIRAVPTSDLLSTAGTAIRAALHSDVVPQGDAGVPLLRGDAGVPLAGRLPLAAWEGHGEPGVGDATVPTAPMLAADEAALAARVARRTVGTLWCVVSGRGGGGVLVGEVTWLATQHGWVGVRPEPDDTDRRMVALEPVARDDIGVWVAPYLAEILEVAGEQ
jgi:hypothetical protein